MTSVAEEDPHVMEEESVELIDYLQVLWRHRRMIVTGTLGAITAAAVFSWVSPPVYQAAMLIKIGTVVVSEKDSGAKPVLIEGPKTISQVLTSDAMLAKLNEHLAVRGTTIESLKRALVVKVIKNDVDDSGTSLLEVTLKLGSPALVVDGLGFLAAQVIEEHQAPYQASLAIIDREQASVKDRLEANQALQASLRKRIAEMRVHIESERRYRTELDRQYARLQEEATRTQTRLSEFKTDSADAVLAQNLFQNLQIRLDGLHNEQNQTDVRIRQSQDDILGVENDLALGETQRADLESRIVQLAGYRARSENTKIRSVPVLPSKPVAPKMALNIAVAGVLGVMVSVMAAFLREYIHTARQRRAFVSNLLH